MSDDWFASPLWLQSPRHVVSAAVVVANPDDEILLVESPRRGWEIPGGQVELNESIQDAALREVREESGILVELLGLAGVFQNVPKSICSFLFKAKPIGGALQTSGESTRVGWFPVPSALTMVSRPTMRARIEMTLASSSRAFMVEHLGDQDPNSRKNPSRSE